MGDRYWQLNSRVEDKITGQAGRVATVTNDHGRESLTVQYDDGSWCEQPVECWKYVGPAPSPTDLPDAVVEAAAEAINKVRGYGGMPPSTGEIRSVQESSLEYARAALAAASGPWAEQLDAAKPMEPHEKELRKLWREVAEKGIEQGVDWPRIVTTLFGDIDAALARNAELEAEVQNIAGGALVEEAETSVRRIHAEVERDVARQALTSADAMNRHWDEINAHRDLLVAERDALRAELDNLRGKLTALAKAIHDEGDERNEQNGHKRESYDKWDAAQRIRAIVRGSDDE